MTRKELEQILNIIRQYKARAERLDRIKAKIIELRDKATLQTTKAIYNAILALFDEED